MANTKNAKKRILVNENKKWRNNTYRASMKTACKKVEKSIANKDKEAAETNLRIAIKGIDKAVGANVVSKNTASRKKSRLTKKVNQMC